MPAISIIVPVYNVEPYLGACLDSIQAQSFTDWECIIVDDGSPDRSAAIAQQYVARDARFKLVSRPNGGLSAARNTGLQHATGTYIGFVDSDDWIEPRTYRVLYDAITQHNADMAQVGIFKEYVGITHRKPLAPETVVLDQRQLMQQLFLDKMLPSYMCNKLFRRDVITTPFPEGRVFEDIYTLSHWATGIHTAVLSPEPMYHYRFRRGSIAHTSSPSNRIQYLEACIERCTLFEHHTPGFISDRRRDKVLWKTALRSARKIARMTALPRAARLDALRQLIGICTRCLAAPHGRTLGRITALKARTLLRHPNRYIGLALLTGALDLHGKYRTTHAYN